MSGICDTCSLSKECRKPIGGVDSCRRYIKRKESNYKKLFGTPERAARTLADISERLNFDGIGGDYDALLGWLKGDA